MNYLNNITLLDIELLSQDLTLMERGYELNYIVDASDIITFAFPYGIKFNLLHTKTPDVIGDSLIAYEYVFNQNKPVLLDEYKTELLLNRNSIRANNDSKLQKNILDVTLDKYDDIKVISKLLSQNATFLLGTSIMQEKMVRKFDNIYFNRLQKNSFELKNRNLDDEKIIIETFKRVKRSSWSENLFNFWVDLSKNINFNDPYIIREYKSTLRDFIALDRIFQVNQSILKNKNLDKKYLFQYFSGANKSLDFFKLDMVVKSLPTVDEFENFNILRTPKHTFVLFLIYDKDVSTMKSSLEEIKQYLEAKEKLNKSKGKLTKELDKTFFEKLSLKRNNLIENLYINNQVSRNYELRNHVLKKIEELEKAGNKDEIAEIYKEFLYEAKRANKEIGLLQTNSAYLLEGKIILLIQKLSENNNYSIDRGVDLVKGAYHHLPILMFVYSKSNFNNKKLESLFFKLVDYVIATPSFKEQELDSLIVTVKNVCNFIENSPYIKESHFEILIKAFILLVIESADSISDEVSDIIEQSYLRLKINKPVLNIWGADHLYTLVWINRRINSLSKSDKYCNEGLSHYPTDPRFLHGKCLLLYNKYLDTNLKSPSENQLNEILDFGEKAINTYYLLLTDEQFFRPEYKDYIDGSISAINNLILYSISLFYLHTLESIKKIDALKLYKDKYSLSYLRDNLLKTIKDFEMKRNNTDKGWAEYCHTEAMFELVESIYYGSKDKLEHSLEAINRALEISPQSKLYKNSKIIIQDWFEKL